MAKKKKLSKKANPVIAPFEAWLKKNHGRFKIPIQIDGRTKDRLDMSFVGITPFLTASIIWEEKAVYADWKGECWDVVAEFGHHQ